jgi:hypothetical protein
MSLLNWNAASLIVVVMTVAALGITGYGSWVSYQRREQGWAKLDEPTEDRSESVHGFMTGVFLVWQLS